MKKIIFSGLLLLLFNCQNSEEVDSVSIPNNEHKLEILLIGSFHFNNFVSGGNDIIQTKVIDVLEEKYQKELEEISDKISIFNPSKIFIEEKFSQQNKTDSLYKNYVNETFNYKNRNESYQLGFRTAKKLKHKKIYGIDYSLGLDFENLFKEMEKAKQFELIRKDEIELEQIENYENKLYASGKSLKEILYYFNDEKYRKADINWYVNLANQAGSINNYVGSDFTTQWYKRNFYMYSLMQKQLEPKDKRIVIIAGASHIALFKEFIKYNPNWKTIELKEVLN